MRDSRCLLERRTYMHSYVPGVERGTHAAIPALTSATTRLLCSQRVVFLFWCLPASILAPGRVDVDAAEGVHGVQGRAAAQGASRGRRHGSAAQDSTAGSNSRRMCTRGLRRKRGRKRCGNGSCGGGGRGGSHLRGGVEHYCSSRALSSRFVSLLTCSHFCPACCHVVMLSCCRFLFSRGIRFDSILIMPLRFSCQCSPSVLGASQC